MSNGPTIQRLARLAGGELHKRLGATIAGRLICRECGREQDCPPDAAAAYLRRGWPRCCGLTMELVTDSPPRDPAGDQGVTGPAPKP